MMEGGAGGELYFCTTFQHKLIEVCYHLLMFAKDNIFSANFQCWQKDKLLGICLNPCPNIPSPQKVPAHQEPSLIRQVADFAQGLQGIHGW